MTPPTKTAPTPTPADPSTVPLTGEAVVALVVEAAGYGLNRTTTLGAVAYALAHDGDMPPEFIARREAGKKSAAFAGQVRAAKDDASRASGAAIAAWRDGDAPAFVTHLREKIDRDALHSALQGAAIGGWLFGMDVGAFGFDGKHAPATVTARPVSALDRAVIARACWLATNDGQGTHPMVRDVATLWESTDAATRDVVRDTLPR